ncbi:MAG: hypothetical protein K1Y02_19815 [Candidatus Hydrogenedentes bacterium]|nr:hypothetical protein [Candidatus Hydrogenedentota bacterium]
MILVNIGDLKPGQVIAKAVTNAGGAVLCPAGYRLTETSIERLKNAGVDAVVLDTSDSPESNEATIDLRLAELEARFRGIDDPIMLQIKATIEKRLSFMRLG